MRVDVGQPYFVPNVHLFRRPPTTQAVLGHRGAEDVLIPVEVKQVEAALVGPTDRLLRSVSRIPTKKGQPG